MSSWYDCFIRWIREGYSRPWDRTEKILIALTAAALLSDALTTLGLRQHALGLTHTPLWERNPVIDDLLSRNPLSLFAYFLSWLVVVILFRIIQSAEFTIAILHIMGNGIASVNNLGFILFGEPIIVSLLDPYCLRIEHLILIVILIYLSLKFFYMSKAQNQHNISKSAFLCLIGLFLGSLTEFGIKLIWLRLGRLI